MPGFLFRNHLLLGGGVRPRFAVGDAFGLPRDFRESREK
jgi:hypothetical protein